MKIEKLASVGVAAIVSVLLAAPCMAQKAGDNILYFGYADMEPSSSLGPVSNTNATVTQSGATVATSAQVQSASTAVLTWFHMVTDNVGAELTLGVPLTMNSTITAPNAGNVGLRNTAMPNAITQTVSFPSLVAKYLFNAPTDKLRPYLGLGVNYTQFDNVTPAQSYNTVHAFAGNGASLSSSWNPVYNAGLIYNIDAHWSLNAGISYVPLSTNVTLNGAPAGPNTATATLTINPTDYTFKVGYKF